MAKLVYDAQAGEALASFKKKKLQQNIIMHSQPSSPIYNIPLPHFTTPL